jgi:putative oxidoreductase
MPFTRVLVVREHSYLADAALLLLRLITGTAFILHGWPKIQNPFGWMPPGFAPPPMLALAALAEFGGGILLILGFLTPLAALGIACTMATAFYMHAFIRGDPFVANELKPTWEPAAVYFGVAVTLLTLGPGRLSLDARLFRRPVRVTTGTRQVVTTA